LLCDFKQIPELSEHQTHNLTCKILVTLPFPETDKAWNTVSRDDASGGGGGGGARACVSTLLPSPAQQQSQDKPHTPYTLAVPEVCSGNLGSQALHGALLPQ
jgi:hypothetical protein